MRRRLPLGLIIISLSLGVLVINIRDLHYRQVLKSSIMENNETTTNTTEVPDEKLERKEKLRRLARSQIRVFDGSSKNSTSEKLPKGPLPVFNNHLWPLDIDLNEIARQNMEHLNIGSSPITTYTPFFWNHTTSNCTVRNNEPPFLVIVVKSASQNFDHRHVLRQTWGNANYTNNLGIKVVYLLGRAKDTSLETSIRQESNKFQDIIQGTFLDTYYTNTLKSSMGFNWFIKFCDDAKYLMFVDDDYVVWIDRISSLLRSHKLDDCCYYGELFHHAPIRDEHSKWYVSTMTYPFQNYPPFINAGMYLMSREVARKFHIGIQYTQHFILDDVFIGIVAHKLGIKPSNIFNIVKEKYVVHHFGNHTAVNRQWQAKHPRRGKLI